MINMRSCMGVSTLMAALFFGACSSKNSATNQTANANAEPTPAPLTVAIDASNTARPEAIDLSAHNANIARLEDQAARLPGDDAARLALSRAYLGRAKALTEARQYRAALDDYRHVLQYDPDNGEAPQLAASITNLLQNQGQEVPTEGNEPPPLAITPDTIPGDEAGSSSSAKPAREQSSPARKKGKQ
jgi:tetratricopeptide (TPR) repeat protein